MLGYEGISAGVRGYKCRVTRVLVPGYEGISAGVRGYLSRGTRVLQYRILLILLFHPIILRVIHQSYVIQVKMRRILSNGISSYSYPEP